MHRNIQSSVLIGCLLIGHGLFNAPAASAATTLSFSFLITNPTASAQPTAHGKTIQDMAVKNGLLYCGYGDYDANTGPIAISALDLTTRQFRTLGSAVPTEEINVFRQLGEALYAPEVDPRLPWNANVGFATDASGSWQVRHVTPFEHVFDVASSNGTDLWLAGGISDSTGTKEEGAALKRSTDGGATWTVERNAVSSPAPNGYDRYMWIAAAAGRIYAKPWLISPLASTENQVDVWSNGSWSTLADPYRLIEFSASANTVVSFTGRVIMPSGAYIDGATNAIGISATGVGRARDFFIDGATLYVLGTYGIAKTQNGYSWSVIPGSLPTGWIPSSIAVAGGQIYLGGSDGKIYISALPS